MNWTAQSRHVFDLLFRVIFLPVIHLLDVFLYITDLVLSYLWLHAIAACIAGELNSAAAQLS